MTPSQYITQQEALCYYVRQYFKSVSLPVLLFFAQPRSHFRNQVLNRDTRYGLALLQRVNENIFILIEIDCLAIREHDEGRYSPRLVTYEAEARPYAL